ncbi:MAG: type II secretion system F family protein [Anaerostipes sp.]|nr:type II secretion system F family protein [Anaerostipes sp.]
MCIQSYFCGTKEELEKEVWRSFKEQWKKVIWVFLVFLAVICLAAASELLAGQEIIIHRNAEGEEINQELSIDTGREKELYELNVQPKAYSREEEKKAFQKGAEYLKKHMKGKNSSLNEVKEALDFPNRIPGTQIKVSWETEDLSVIDEEGNVFSEGLKQPVILKTTAVLSYGDHRELITVPVRVVPNHAGKKESKLEGTKKELKSIEREHAQEESFAIPSTVKGSSVRTGEQVQGRLPVLAVMGILCLGLLWYTEEERQKQKKAKALKETRDEYPLIISKLVLLLGAGMTIQGAVHSIALSYDTKHPKFIYRQFQEADKKITLGMPQTQALKELGSSIQMPCYKKLAVLMSQSLVRGSKDLLGRLEEEEAAAFAERKETARRKGEEASTRLLMPMILMLVVILTLLMVPAFLSFS